MFKATLTLDPEDGEYCAPYDIPYPWAGDWVLCGHGLVTLFNFEADNLPEKIDLLVCKDKPKNKKGWFKAILTSEQDSEICFPKGQLADCEIETPVYYDLMVWINVELAVEIKEGDSFWISIEY